MRVELDFQDASLSQSVFYPGEGAEPVVAQPRGTGWTSGPQSLAVFFVTVRTAFRAGEKAFFVWGPVARPLREALRKGEVKWPQKFFGSKKLATDVLEAGQDDNSPKVALKPGTLDPNRIQIRWNGADISEDLESLKRLLHTIVFSYFPGVFPSDGESCDQVLLFLGYPDRARRVQGPLASSSLEGESAFLHEEAAGVSASEELPNERTISITNPPLDAQWAVNLGLGFAAYVACAGKASSLPHQEFRKLSTLLCEPCRELGLEVSLPGQAEYSLQRAQILGNEIETELGLRNTRISSVFNFVWRVCLLLSAKEDGATQSSEESELLEAQLTRAAQNARLFGQYSRQLIHSIAWESRLRQERKQQEEMFISWVYECLSSE